ncbi:MAG: MlaD family protein [Armatimonadota bacterium]|nr:MlaD family protein [bacterium]
MRVRLKNEAKVGLIVFIAFLAFVAVYWFLGGFSLTASSYPVYAIFPSAQNLDKGSDVRMAGVKIGVVRSIDLTGRNRARVNMLIWKENKIPVDSLAEITTAGFIGDNYVDILPGRSHKYVQSDGRIETRQVVQFDELMEQTGLLLSQLQVTAGNINKILGDKEMQSTLRETIKALKKSTESSAQLIESARALLNQSAPQVQETFANLAVASEEAARVSKELDDMMTTDARPNIKALLGEARETMANLNIAIKQAGGLVSSFEGNSASISQALNRANEAAEQAVQMLTNLNEASSGIKDLATDKDLQQNLKATLCNAAQASEQANQLLTGLNKRFGGTGENGGPTPQQKAAIPQYGITADGLWDTGDGNYRFDANYTFAGRDDSFYRLGLRDIGEETRLNLQGGLVFTQHDAFRYGMYASRLGVGYDRSLLGRKMLISADLFRPNDPNLELRGVLGVSNHFGVYTGVSDLFDPDGRNVLLGVRYSK